MLLPVSPTLEQSLYPVAVNNAAVNPTTACARVEHFAKPRQQI